MTVRGGGAKGEKRGGEGEKEHDPLDANSRGSHGEKSRKGNRSKGEERRRGGGKKCRFPDLSNLHFPVKKVKVQKKKEKKGEKTALVEKLIVTFPAVPRRWGSGRPRKEGKGASVHLLHLHRVGKETQVDDRRGGERKEKFFHCL